MATRPHFFLGPRRRGRSRGSGSWVPARRVGTEAAELLAPLAGRSGVGLGARRTPSGSGYWPEASGRLPV
ncbi:hypothetical protein [Amycolatopsis palatopharyngis]|uniref:hypothetical protein n=1 Tax=Amycolatopsis palatopharyngis TaxID=187982 RepID=UPI0013BEA889|nr:hypothetical protein [Amycolatopsis palatopharyngis]